MLPTSLPLVIGPLNSFLEPSRLLREYKACATISALTCTRLPLTLRDTSLMTETQTHILLNRNTLEHGVSYPLGHDTHQPLTITLFFLFFIYTFLELNQSCDFLFFILQSSWNLIDYIVGRFTESSLNNPDIFLNQTMTTSSRKRYDNFLHA